MQHKECVNEIVRLANHVKTAVEQNHKLKRIAKKEEAEINELALEVMFDFYEELDAIEEEKLQTESLVKSCTDLELQHEYNEKLNGIKRILTTKKALKREGILNASPIFREREKQARQKSVTDEPTEAHYLYNLYYNALRNALIQENSLFKNSVQRFAYDMFNNALKSNDFSMTIAGDISMALSIKNKPVATSIKSRNEPIEIKNKLEKYIGRINSYTRRSHPNNIDYAHGFLFFKKSRALNRRVNHLLAIELHQKLTKNNAIYSTFHNVDNLRNNIILNNRLSVKKNYVERGNNSRELCQIIHEANDYMNRMYL